ncbi:MAG TPA: branched-chain amino acid ABC transporter permease [Acidimicrobiia bacterium]|nr:branched-chain amino acid ABC transporter permease [Acidimicrobiia bacterium]
MIVRRWRLAALLAGVVLLALLPQLQLSVPGVLPGPTSTAGTLQLLTVCLLVGALAVTYDLLFGLAGLLSFGHALSFAIGCYLFAIALDRWHLAIAPAALLTLAIGILAAVLVGAVSLRVGGISFAMVTLAFAQAGSLLVYRNFGGFTGGEEGLGLARAKLPGWLVGVVNTRNLYWTALVIAVVVYAAVAWLNRTQAGRMMAAVRENALRVQVFGVRPYVVRLIAFVAAGALATLVGMAYLLVHGGASPQVTTPSFTLSLLVMVVLGGAGARWGALLGGILYTLLDQRLAVLASSSRITSLPGVLRVPLSQPLFLLGTLFVLVVLFLPGGLAGAISRLRRRAEPAPGVGRA